MMPWAPLRAKLTGLFESLYTFHSGVKKRRIDKVLEFAMVIARHMPTKFFKREKSDIF